MTKDNPLGNHEMTFLPIKHQVSFLASFQYDVLILQTQIKWWIEDGKIIHENFDAFFNQVGEDVAGAFHKPKGILLYAKTPKGTSERRLLMIFEVDSNLIVAEVPIKKATESLAG